MKNTICEKLMWAAMTPTMFKFIYENCGEVDTSAVKKKARKNYKAMVERTPDIGSFMKNTLRVSLVGGIVWLSVYNAMDGKMSHEQFGEMVKVTMQAPLIQKAFGGKNPFDSEYQNKKAEKDKVTNAMSDSEFNWITETIPGRNADEYTTIYHRCGLCALGRQEHHEDLIPYMCEMDFISVDLMGGVLHRTGTIAAGAEMCDFYVCKKGSEWDKEIRR
ncbi:MAG: L-2-amino-thiazoline-4-carboxylic acid hydrolase [Ruminococcus sp.]|nr:L-2-amino-thiazoline-4-carboxylic acid hydrolase [Ruminococcus sp.]